MDTITLTGKSRFRTLHRGIWPFRSVKLVLQVEYKRRIEIWADGSATRPVDIRTTIHWRDAKFEDLTVGECRELFCRENPR